MNYAYVSLLSSDSYIYYTVALIDSHRLVKSKYPLYIIVTEEVSKNTLKILDSMHAPYIVKSTNKVKEIASKMSSMKMVAKYVRALSKLTIFSLTQFDKCVYLDSDLVLYHNIDDLFDKPEWTAVEDCLPVHKRPQDYVLGESSFCSGMFVFKPSLELYNKLINNLSSLPANIKWHDQNILAYYNQDWMQKSELHLPAEYDLLIASREDVLNVYLKNGGKQENIKVKHYVSYKDAPYNEPKYLNKNVYDEYVNYYKYINNVIAKYGLNLKRVNILNLKVK